MVSPSTAAALPNASPPSPSEATRSCDSFHIFEKVDDGWEETQILRGSNSNDLRFGWDVALDGLIIVGSELRNSEQSFIAGAAYVYKREDGELHSVHSFKYTYFNF